MNDDLVLVNSESDPEALTVLCECGRSDCATELTVNAEVYRVIRGGTNQFIVSSGHEGPPADKVVRRLGTVTVVRSTYLGTMAPPAA